MIGSLVLFIGAVCAALFYVYWKSEHSTVAKTIDLIPGPPKIPILGTYMDTTAILQTMEENIKTYGRVHRLWVLGKPIVCVSSPRGTEVILTSKVNIDKGFYDSVEPWLGRGILLSGGSQWKETRRLLNPAFHVQILESFFDVFNKNATILAELLERESNGSNDREVDVNPFIKRCTLDIICDTAMGISVNAQIETDSQYIMAVESIIYLIIKRTYSLWSLLPDWMYMLMSADGQHFRKDVTLLHNFTKTVIQHKKRRIYEEDDTSEDVNGSSYVGTRKKRAFLDLLLLAAKEGADLSDENIQNEVDTFMAAGSDTTSTTVAMFLYCMAVNPQYQKLVQEELDEVFGDSDRECTMNDTANMKYMEYCLKESLRLYSTVPSIGRTTSEDIEIDGYQVPAGTGIFLQMFYLHRNPEYFPDPLTYDPERFRPENCIGRHPFAFVPFSGGPRNCIGQKFANFEAKVIISALLRKFTFSYKCDRKPLQLETDLVLKPVNGIPLIITPRH